MSRFICLLALTTTTGLCAYLAWPIHQPIYLRVEPGEFPLAEVEQGTTHELTYHIHNHTWDTIEILDVLKTCECVDAKISQPVIQRGETCKITAKWNVGTSRCPQYIPITIVMKNRTTGEEFREIVCATAVVRSSVELDPPAVVFEKEGYLQTVLVKVMFRNPERKVLNVRSTAGHEMSAIWDESRSILEIGYIPNANPGIQVEKPEVFVETNDPIDPVIKVPITIK